MNIIIDKTDKNAVLAREQAIVEAQRTAFQKLAERSMAPERFKNYIFPDDNTITALVQDFEIKNERISTNRYVASFTVRFNPEIANHIKIPAGAGAIIIKNPSSTSVATGINESRIILILPYFEDISGKKLLWEDPNPWREAWQAAGNSILSKKMVITVPLGDIADISSGNTNAVWSGDYSVIEKMRVNYGATEVALVVANKSSIYIRSNIYIYKNGKLDRKGSITPHTSGQNDKTSFKQTVVRVIHALQIFKPLPSVVSPSNTVKVPPEKISLETVVNFKSFAQWLDVQKRLSYLSPALTVEISGLSKISAKLALGFEGSLGTFRIALAKNGLILHDPAVTIFSNNASALPPLYELKLIN